MAAVLEGSTNTADDALVESLTLVPSCPNVHIHKHAGMTSNTMPSLARPPGGFPLGAKAFC